MVETWAEDQSSKIIDRFPWSLVYKDSWKKWQGEMNLDLNRVQREDASTDITGLVGEEKWWD